MDGGVRCTSYNNGALARIVGSVTAVYSRKLKIAFAGTLEYWKTVYKAKVTFFGNCSQSVDWNASGSKYDIV